MTYARELYEAGKVNFRVLVETGRGKSETSFFFSWRVPSGQVAMGPGRENSHRQREEEGECSGSTLNMWSRPQASGMHAQGPKKTIAVWNVIVDLGPQTV